MNHTYRLIWNKVRQAFVAVAENARSHGGSSKSKPRRLLQGAVPLSLLLAAGAVHAQQLPGGAEVVAGDVSFATPAAGVFDITQAGAAAIVNWADFSIGHGATVNIVQDNAQAALLNRVTGANPSELLGQLNANGRVYLINPNGVVVGRDASINTMQFVASALDVADQDFLDGGDLHFTGASNAGVLNLGTITAAGGDVILVAYKVANAGEIAAPGGVAALAAGRDVLLSPQGDQRIFIKAALDSAAAVGDAAIDGTGAENSGVIAAARAELQAAGGNLYALAVNQSGFIQATGVEHHGGRVLLTAAGGTVAHTGTISAHDADGSGGEILVGGDFQGKNPAVLNAARTYVGPGAQLNTGDASTTGGKVIVWADDSARYAGHIETGRGGEVEVSGKQDLAFSGSVDTHGGSLLLDPDDITIVAGTTTPLPNDLTGVPLTWQEASDPGNQTLGAATLAGLLATNSVTLQASNTLTVNAPVTVAAGGAAPVGLHLQAPTIAINQPLSLANVSGGELTFYGGHDGVSLSSTAAGALSASRIYISSFPLVALNGAVTADEFTYEALSVSPGSLTATNAANAFARFIVNTDGADPQPVAFSGDVSVHSDSALSVQALIGAAANVTLSATGNLTLEDTDGFTPATAISASGVTKLASTGGVLVNQAGTDLLDGAARRLLYSSSTDAGAGFDLGGLAGYTQFDGVSFPDDPQSAEPLALYHAGGGVFTLTVTADDFFKPYGAALPAFTASFAGFKPGDDASLVNGLGFATAASANSPVGTYAIVPSGASAAGYNLSYVNGTLTVNPALLTVSANDTSRSYGAANPGFSATASGLVNGDTLAGVVSGLSFATDATEASDVGNYAITLFGATAFNYTLSFSPGTLSVNPAPLTIAADDKSRTEGKANPELTATFTGLANNDTAADFGGLTLHTTALPGSAVGDYPITVGGAANANYAITFVNGVLTVKPMPVLTIAVDDFTKFYGAALPEFTASITGFIPGDTESLISGLGFSTTASAASGIGTYPIVPSGGSVPGYKLAYVPGTLTIAPALLTITAASANRVYGAANPAFSATYSGFVNGEGSSLVSGLSIATAARSDSDVGSYAITPSGASARNYAITFVPGTLKIDPLSLTVYARDASRLYGGTNPVFSWGLRGDIAHPPGLGNFNVTTSATETSDVGSYVLRVVRAIFVPFNPNNFDLTLEPGTLTIKPAPLTVSIADVTRNRGEANPPDYSIHALDGLEKEVATDGIVRVLNPTTTDTSIGVYDLGAESLSANYTVDSVSGRITIVDPRMLGLSGLSLSQVQLGSDPDADQARTLSAAQTPLRIGSADAPPGLMDFFADSGNIDFGVEMLSVFFQSNLRPGINAFPIGTLAAEISGVQQGTSAELSQANIRAWLERNADDPAALAQLAEPLSNYASAFLRKNPANYTAADVQFSQVLERNMEKSRDEFAARVEERYEAWMAQEAAAGNTLTTLAGRDVPWKTFIAEGASDYVAEMIEAQVAIGGGSAAAIGTMAGVAVGMNFATLVPYAAGAKAGAVLGSASAGAGVAAIVVTAVVVSVIRGVEVFNNAQQEILFNDLRASVGQDLDPYGFALETAAGRDNVINQAIFFGALAGMLTP